MKYLIGLLVFCFSLTASADHASDRAAIAALGNQTSAPAMYEVDTSTTIYQSTDTSATLVPSTTEQTRKAIFFDSVDYLGNPTKVYAWVGMPKWNPVTDSPLPAIVLVHGGGGAAEETWVNLWAERGYVAISIDTEGASNTTSRHSKGGPRRTGVFNESSVAIGNQFMFHATAGSILANSLMRSLSFVDQAKVGIHGISWGGLITSTVIGIDTRFAFAIPSYGCGHMWDGIGKWQENIADAGGTDYYKNVWDSMLWIENATMPIMWLSWPKENNFNLDCQANSYNKAPGTRMISLIPGMGHSQVFTWRRADSYDFADSIVGNNSGSTGVSANTPWCVQNSLSLTGNQIVVEFESTRDLTGAKLVYTNEMGSTTFMAWPEVAVDSFGETSPGSGIWQVTATLPADATGWFVNVTADTSILETVYLDGRTTYISGTVHVSSRLQEVVEVVQPGLVEMPLSEIETSVTGNVSVNFTAIHNLEVTSVGIVNETHPGAFSCDEPFTFGLITGEPFQVAFDNAVAGLSSGESATATLRLTWVGLDNVTTDTIDVPLRATVDSALAAAFTWDGAGANARWTDSGNWVDDTSPPFVPETGPTHVIISDVGGRTTSNTYSDYTLGSLAFDGSIDDLGAPFVINVYRSNSFVRKITFDHGGSNAMVSVDAGSDGNIVISDLDTAGSIVLNDSLNLVHNGTGTLTFDLMIGGAAGEANGITSSGSGAVIMQGVNVYTGDTIVEGGSLTMESGSSMSFVPTTNGATNRLAGISTGTGTVNMKGEINIHLATADNTPGNCWMLVDHTHLTVAYDAGSFSVNSSLGPFSNNSGVWTLDTGDQVWTFTQVEGILEVADASSSAYGDWAGREFTNPFTASEPSDDFDNDGLSNLLEFVLGGDPTISEAGIAPVVSESGNEMQVTFQRSDVSKQSPTTSVILEVSEDLTFTTPVNRIPIGDVSVPGPIEPLGASYTVSNSGGFDNVVVTIPRTGISKNFARVVAIRP